MLNSLTLPFTSVIGWRAGKSHEASRKHRQETGRYGIPVHHQDEAEERTRLASFIPCENNTSQGYIGTIIV